MYSSISVVIPVYNSKNSLRELYVGLSAELTAICRNFEIIMVDDGSSDDSFEEMCRLHSIDESVKIIRLDGNFGQQNAIMCGLRKASGEYVVTMDDDLQNPPEEIRKLIERLEEGFDVVYGIPEDKKHSAFRNFGTAMTDLLFDIICGKPVKVKVGSFRAMKREFVNMISKDKTSFVYITAITLKYTKNIGNIKVRHDERKYGSSNYSLKKLLWQFFRLFINYADLPFHICRDSKPQYVIKNQQL